MLGRGGGGCRQSGYINEQLVSSNAARIAAIECGEQIVVGVNKFKETGRARSARTRTQSYRRSGRRARAVEALRRFRDARDASAVEKALAELTQAAESGGKLMLASIAAARQASPPANGAMPCAACSANTARRPESRARAHRRRSPTRSMSYAARSKT